MAETAAWWAKPREVTVCVDTEGWFDSFAYELVERINAGGDHAAFLRTAAEVHEGEVAFFLSCTRLTPPDVLARNRHNIVVHASALPEGRGFSPAVWQILEGRNRIPLSMIFAANEPDSGDIVMQQEIVFDGTELNEEIRDRLGREIQEMCLAYLNAPEPPAGRPQAGEPSWYRRRTPEDSRLDPNRSIAEQFDLLRTVDNDRYPAFFDYRGRRYRIRIEPDQQG
jgi:methionyl-tRNA formyltransferase